MLVQESLKVWNLCDDTNTSDNGKWSWTKKKSPRMCKRNVQQTPQAPPQNTHQRKFCRQHWPSCSLLRQLYCRHTQWDGSQPFGFGCWMMMMREKQATWESSTIILSKEATWRSLTLAAKRQDHTVTRLRRETWARQHICHVQAWRDSQSPTLAFAEVLVLTPSYPHGIQ